MPKIETTFSMALQWVALAIKKKQYDLAEDTLSTLISQAHALEKLDNAEKLSDEVIKEVKKIYRSLHPGGCQIISKGLDCCCFLCRCDKIIMVAKARCLTTEEAADEAADEAACAKR